MARHSRHIRIVALLVFLITSFSTAAPEKIETESSRELTAEEIIARHQQVQKVQDDLIERWTAAASGESIVR